MRISAVSLFLSAYSANLLCGATIIDIGRELLASAFGFNRSSNATRVLSFGGSAVLGIALSPPPNLGSIGSARDALGPSCVVILCMAFAVSISESR